MRIIYALCIFYINMCMCLNMHIYYTRTRARAGAVFGGKFGGEGIGVFVDEKCAIALTVGADRAGFMAGNLDKAQFPEILVQSPGLTSGGCILDKFKAINAHRVFKQRRFAARMRGAGRCGAHRDVPIGMPLAV